MHTLLIIVLLCFLESPLHTAKADCDCKENLEFVYTQLRESKSYKTQKNNAKLLDERYNSIISELDSTNNIGVFDCYSKAVYIISTLSDNHNDIRNTEFDISYADYADSAKFKAFEESEHFDIYPFYRGSLSGLQESLEVKSIEDLEGIYVYKNIFKIGLHKNGIYYDGVVLDSKLPSWRPGELIIRLIPLENNRFQIIMGHMVNKSLRSSIDKFKAGYLMQQNWKKEKIAHADYYKEIYPDSVYVFHRIDPQTAYLKLGSFKSNPKGVADAREFSKGIQDSLYYDHLIVDLRENTGGGKKNSGHFKKVLSKYKGKMVVLINFRTKSQAEIFALWLKGKSNVILAGDDTAGIISYGRNYPDRKTSPDGCFSVHFSDLGGILYRNLESVGIAPDEHLAFNRDWIEQALGILNQ